MSTQSSSANYLVGRKLPGGTQPVADIQKKGNSRTVVYADGTKEVMSKAALKDRLIATIADTQRAKAERGMRTQADGTTAVTIGGAKRGERKTYASPAAAKAAVTRHYGKKGV